MPAKLSTVKGKDFRVLKSAAFAALVGGSALMLLVLPAAHGAVLTVGESIGVFGSGSEGPPFGGIVCADVAGANLNTGTPVQAWNCNAAPNQQFEFYNFQIYTLGAQRCLDVLDDNTSPGAPVDSALCNGTAAQEWEYRGGYIVNDQTGFCLDATNMVNGTQLVMNPCGISPSQLWQIK